MIGADANVVSIQGLTKSFRTGVTALDNIDLEVAPREFVSLIGPSGCGKSTLLRIFGDLVSPSSGTVHVNGKTAHQARVDHDYGIVFQDAVLLDWRTVTKPGCDADTTWGRPSGATASTNGLPLRPSTSRCAPAGSVWI